MLHRMNINSPVTLRAATFDPIVSYMYIDFVPYKNEVSSYFRFSVRSLSWTIAKNRFLALNDSSVSPTDMEPELDSYKGQLNLIK